MNALSPSIANAGIDRIVCNQSTIELNGNVPVSGSGTWTEITNNSTAVISSASSPTTNVNTLNTGEHFFVWSIANADKSCYSRDTLKIINNILPNTALAGKDDTFCVFNTIQLNANQSIAGTLGSWSIISGPNNPIVQNSNQANSLLSGVIPGQYVLRWSISNLSCPTSSDEVHITIIENANQAIAGADQTLCTTELNLYGNLPSGSNKGEWSQFEGPALATIITPFNSNSVVTNLIPGIYRFVWKIFNAGCFTTDTVTYTIKESAKVFAGNDKVICSGTAPVLLSDANFVSPEDNKAVWTLITGSGILNTTFPTSKPDTVKYIPAVNEQGNVIIRLSAQDACRVLSDDLQISLNQSLIPVIAMNDFIRTDFNTAVSFYVLENDTILYDDTLKLCDLNSIITYPKNGVIVQQTDGSFLYTPSSIFSGLDSFQYQICTDALLDSNLSALCFQSGSDSAWVYLNVISKDCFIPNAFSPNGDGINDAFVIECGKEKQLSVFNHYGIELYRNDDYQNDWQGNYQDLPLPDGTYFYNIKYKSETNEIINQSGFICLHR